MSDFNMDNLLDGTLDDLADLPEFRPFPPGLHSAVFSWEQKVVNNHPSIEVRLKAKETIELAKPADEENKPLVGGEEASVLYMMDNEIGQGSFKENILKPLAAHFGAKQTRELLKDAQGATVSVVTDLRANKEKTKSYMTIVKLEVA